MKKEVKSVSPTQPPVKGDQEVAGAGGSPPTNIKSDPDSAVNGENTVNNTAVNNSNNNCDNSTPGTPVSGCPGDQLPGGGAGGHERDSSTPGSGGADADKKPVISDPPSNGLIKTETDFLDTFDTKDGGKHHHYYLCSSFSYILKYLSQSTTAATCSRATTESLVFNFWKHYTWELRGFFLFF